VHITLPLVPTDLQDEVLLAYQIGFDLFENEMQTFSQQV
jgi:hypothetical protein